MSLLPAIDYAALAPALVAALGAVAVLVADLVLPLPRRSAVLGLAAAGAAGSLAAAVLLIGDRRQTFCVPAGQLPGGVPVARSCGYVVDSFTLFFFVLLTAAAVGALVVSIGYVRAAVLPPGEYGFLVLASLTGALVLVGARDLVTLLVGLETLTLPTYALVGLRRRSLASGEAAVKYLLVSVSATALTLLGVAFVYGLTGTLYLDRVAAAFAARPEVRALPLAAAAVVLVLVGFAFKIAAVPFHWWAPDVYQGAPVPIAAYLATVSKAAGLAGLLLVTLVAFPAFGSTWGWVLAALATASMTLGNLVALRQRHAVRLLAWSSISHAGYLLVPLGALGAGGAGSRDTALSATLGYLGLYVAINLGAFACATAVGRRYPANAIADYRGLAAGSPALSVALGFFLLGLAGLPPTLAGLVAKVVVMRAALLGGAGWLAVVVAVNTVVGLAYYLRLAALPFQAPLQAPEPAPAGVGPAGVGPDGLGGVVAEPVPGLAPVGSRLVGPTLAVAIGAVVAVTLVLGVAPQVVLGAVSAVP